MDDPQSFIVIGNHHGHVEDGPCFGTSEKDQVAGLGVIDLDFRPLVLLVPGTGRQFNVKFFHHVMCEARTIETAFGVATGVFVFGAEEFAGVINDVAAQLDFLGFRRFDAVDGFSGNAAGQLATGERDQCKKAAEQVDEGFIFHRHFFETVNGGR